MKKTMSIALSIILFTNSTFALNINNNKKEITRAQALKIILDKETIELKTKEIPFKDVSENHPEYKYIKFAFEKGYINGYGNNIFLPDKNITYLEWIALLVRTNKNFDSSKISWKNYVDFAYENNIITSLLDKSNLQKEITKEFANNTFHRMLKDEKTLTAPKNISLSSADEFVGEVENSVAIDESKISRPNPNAVVVFKDEGLKRFLLEHFKTYNGNDDEEDEMPGEYNFKLINKNYRKDASSNEILVKDMEQLEALGIRGYYNYEDFEELEVTDLTGLEYAKNLKMLTISSYDVASPYSANAIKDVTPLQNLKNLEFLRLSHNAIENITPLANIKGLKKLYISHNLIEDISPLNTLTNLTTLDISRNKISDISAIQNLNKLDTLVFIGNKIQDLEYINNLSDLEYLAFSENNITDINILSNLTKLKDIYMDKNKIRDFSAIRNLNELSYLSYNNQEISEPQELSINESNFETDLSFFGLDFITNEPLVISNNVDGISTNYNPLNQKINFVLSPEFIQNNNNSTVDVTLKYETKSKYLFYGINENINLYHSIKLNIEVN